jgi:hypothetical protein
MPSSYTNNGGITLPANGELSGVWGATVNNNMNIIDRITNGVGVVSLAGTTGTLQTVNGALSAGQYKVVIFGGAPSGTNTVTVLPNDSQHVYIVKNSSGQSVVVTQGSGGNVTISNGDSKIIYCDGAGSGAAVVDVSNDLSMSNVSITGGAIDVTPIGASGASSGGFTALSADTMTVGGVTVDSTELGFIDGVSAGVITNSKAVIYGAAGQVNATTLQIAGTSLTPTAAEFNHVSGVTSSIQTQINTKAPSVSPTLTTPTTSGAVTISGGTANWVVTPSGVNLIFSYGGVNKMKLDSSGNLTVVGDITAYGSV